MTVTSSYQVVNPYATTNNLVSGMTTTFCVNANIRCVLPSVYPVRIRDVSTAFPNSIVTIGSIPT